MKKIIQRIAPGLLLAGLSVLTASAQPRIGIVDLQKVFDNYHEKADAEAAIKRKADVLEKDFKAKVDAYDKLKDDYNKLKLAIGDQSVSAEEREKRRTAADMKFEEISATQRNLQALKDEDNDQINLEKKRSIDAILKQIRTVIEAKAKGAGYTLVLDSTANSLNQSPVVLYTNGDNDLTDAVLATLNAASPGGAPSRPAGTSPTKDTSK